MLNPDDSLETDEVKKAARAALNEALDRLGDRHPSVDELASLVELAGPVLEEEEAKALLQIFRQAVSRWIGK